MIARADSFQILSYNPPDGLGRDSAPSLVYQDRVAAFYLLGEFIAVGLCDPKQIRCSNLDHPFFSAFSVDQQLKLAIPQLKSLGGEPAKL